MVHREPSHQEYCLEFLPLSEKVSLRLDECHLTDQICLIPALKEDLNVAVVFQHLAENYVNKVMMVIMIVIIS